MSTYSEIIIFKDKIPDVTKIIALAAQEGVAMRFPNGFDLANPPADYVNYEVDGEKVMFGLSVFPITNLDFVESEERGAPLPKKARKYGDTIMSFQTKGILSGQALLFIQTILAKNYNAAAVFDEEFLTPADLTKEFVPPADMMPELAATFIGTPKERAIAIEQYIDIEMKKRDAIDAANGIVKYPQCQGAHYVEPHPLFIWFRNNPLVVWFRKNELLFATAICILILAIYIWTLFNDKN